MGAKKRKHRQAVIEGKEPPFRASENQKLGCPVPGCYRFLVDGQSPHGFCPYHEDELRFLLFVLPRIEVGPQEIPGVAGLVLPGQPGYVMPEEDIIEEMKRHGRLKP